MSEMNKAAIAQAKLGTGTYSSQGEKLDFTFYDTQKLASTILVHRFFTQGVGKPFTGGGNKTIADSNLISDGIPQGQNFRIHEVKGYYLSEDLKNNDELQSIYDVFEDTVLSLKVANKDVLWQVPLSHLLGSNLNLVQVPSVAGDNINAFNTNTILHGFALKIPIELAALTRYEITMEHTVAPSAALDNDKIQLAIRGRLDRLS